MKSNRICITAIFLGFVLWPLWTFATPVLDQYYEPSDPNVSSMIGGYADGSGGYSEGPYQRGQTFTAGLSGELTQIDMRISRTAGTGDLNLALYSLSGGLPDTQLFEVSIPYISDADPSFTWISFDLSSEDFLVSAGDQYGFALSMTPSNILNSTTAWMSGKSSASDGYVGGQAFHKLGSGAWEVSYSQDLPIDHLFRTYVDVAPIPEPTSLLLLGTGLGVFGLVAYRRRRK